MRQPWRLDDRGERWFDFALAALLVAPFLLATPFGAFTPVTTALGLVQTVPLFWRRRHSVVVAAIVALGCLGQVVATDLPFWAQIAVPVAIYSVARFSTARWGYAALATGLAGAVIGPIDWLGPFLENRAAVASYILTVGAIVFASWALGTLGRTRAAYVASLVERGERLEREAAQNAQLAAQDERARIAREMHDVVAHGLSVIVVQADGARYAAAKDPERATETLAAIAESGRESLAEMRRMLGLLRSEAGSGRAPQPRLADLEHLVEEARAGGMAVEAELPDPLPALPEGVALSVYRIAQESLTNVRKHAGKARVCLRLGYDGREVSLEVVDDGRGAASRGDGKGLGLIGMRERTAAHDGSLSAGPAPGGGFAVSARIPA